MGLGDLMGAAAGMAGDFDFGGGGAAGAEAVFDA